MQSGYGSGFAAPAPPANRGGTARRALGGMASRPGATRTGSMRTNLVAKIDSMGGPAETVEKALAGKMGKLKSEKPMKPRMKPIQDRARLTRRAIRKFNRGTL